MRDITFSLDYDSCVLLLTALDLYQANLEERYKRTDYFFRAYGMEVRKQIEEENRSLLLVKMYHVDRIKNLLISALPPV